MSLCGGSDTCVCARTHTHSMHAPSRACGSTREIGRAYRRACAQAKPADASLGVHASRIPPPACLLPSSSSLNGKHVKPHPPGSHAQLREELAPLRMVARLVQGIFSASLREREKERARERARESACALARLVARLIQGAFTTPPLSSPPCVRTFCRLHDTGTFTTATWLHCCVPRFFLYAR